MPYTTPTTSDFVSNATTASKESVPGATFPVAPNRIYWFEFRMRVSVAATTTGLGLGVDVPASSVLEVQAHIPSVAAIGTDAVQEGSTATDDATLLATDTAIAAGTYATIGGFVTTSATAGSIDLRVDTDAAFAATIKKGAHAYYRDCGAA